jgi:hypothetical protein
MLRTSDQGAISHDYIEGDRTKYISNDIAIALQRGIIPHRHWINTIIAGANGIASRIKISTTKRVFCRTFHGGYVVKLVALMTATFSFEQRRSAGRVASKIACD